MIQFSDLTHIKTLFWYDGEMMALYKISGAVDRWFIMSVWDISGNPGVWYERLIEVSYADAAGFSNGTEKITLLDIMRKSPLITEFIDQVADAEVLISDMDPDSLPLEGSYSCQYMDRLAGHDMSDESII